MTNKSVKVTIVPKIQSLEQDDAKFKRQNLPPVSIQSSLNPQFQSTTSRLTIAPSLLTQIITPSTISPSVIIETAQLQKKGNLPETPTTTKQSTKKRKLLIFLVITIICIVIAAILLSVLLTRKSEVTTGATTAPTIISAYWSFDGTTTDLYGVYNGNMSNGATYSPTSANYFGYGQTLSLNSSLNQSFQVATPFFNLAYTSFTIEGWIYSPTGFTSTSGIFGQCQCSTCANQCLYFVVEGSRLYAGFTLNDVSGYTTLTSSTWYHVAFVYNYQSQQQILYLNGIQENLHSNAQPYQGTNGSIQIGLTQGFSTQNFFNGYIDNVKLVTRTKSATEIINDGSLVAYYSFDLPYPTHDNGPNGLNGTSVNTATVTGRVNQAMLFSGSTSYFQAYGFYQVYGVYSNKPFSISLWLNPTSIFGCTIVQQSLGQMNSSSCLSMIGIYSVAGYTGQIIVQGWAWPFIFGPYLSANTWTHISWTYSNANGYTLYVNGIRFGSTGSTGFGNSGGITWIQIANSVINCQTGYMSNGVYQGLVDEVYVHNRELTQTDVTGLANP